MKQALSLLLITFYIPVAYSQLIELTTGVTSRLETVSFIDDNTGFAGGRGEFGKTTLIKTINGGTTWNTVNINTVNDIYSIDFYNSQLGIILTSEKGFRTKDGGNTWELVEAYGNNVLFNSPNSILSWSDNSGGSLHFSSDTGKNWTNRVSDIEGSLIQDVNFPIAGDSIGFCVGLKGKIFKTTDFGATWVKIAQPTNENTDAIFFDDINNGYITKSSKEGKGGFTYITADGGKNWSIANDSIGGYKIYNTSPTASYVIHFDRVSVSTDKWGSRRVLTGITESIASHWWLTDFDFPSKNVAYFTSATGRMFKLETNLVGIPASSESSLIIEVFPNPSSNLVFIQSGINKINEASLFDITGNKITIEILTISEKEIEFNISNLETGIYIVQINSEQGTITKKIIKN